MFRSILFFAAMCSLAAVPALADVINVTVNGTVSASGTISAVCNPAGTPGCDPGEDGAPPLYTAPFSFTGTNTQLGLFSDSWTATNPIAGEVETTVSESTGASDNGIGIQLQATRSGYAAQYTSQENANVTISFDLTEPYDVTLSSYLGYGSASFGGELLDSSGNVILQIPAGGQDSTTLAPGDYELYAAGSGGGFDGLFFPGTVFNDLYLDLGAQFTPVIPEPRGAFIAALLCAALCGCVITGRRRRA